MADSSCSDVHPDCKSWVSLCGTNDYVKDNCKETCNIPCGMLTFREIIWRHYYTSYNTSNSCFLEWSLLGIFHGRNLELYFRVFTV